jgi:hypothetical protein
VTKHVPVEIVKKENRSITLKWNSSYHGQFVIACNGHEKTIVVESLF